LAVGTLGNTNSINAVVSVVPVSTPRLKAESARTSELVPGRLIQRIEPQYPFYARNANIGGNVVLSATVTKRGTVEKIKVLSGPPLLTQAAINAVRQWRYEPYKLNGEPVDVDTKITVRFDNGRVR
jgi:protein TonB